MAVVALPGEPYPGFYASMTAWPIFNSTAVGGRPGPPTEPKLTKKEAAEKLSIEEKAFKAMTRARLRKFLKC